MRMIYFEMLGHDAEFGFIHAVKYTQKDKLIEKRLGNMHFYVSFSIATFKIAMAR